MTNNLLRVLGKHTSYLNELEARGRAKDGRDLLLQRLMAGVRWMDAQHQAWIDGKPDAATDERFSTALEGWDFLERKLRHEYGYEGCIFGPGQHCPEDAPVRCDACVDDQD
jgi:hypothetical protein